MDSCINTQGGSFNLVIPRLQSQLPSSSSIQIELLAACTPVPLIGSQRPMHADRNELMKPSRTSREPKSPLQNETSSLFIEPASYTSFYQMRIPFRDPLSFMPNLRYILEGLRAANYGQTSVDELLHTITGYGSSRHNSCRNGIAATGNRLHTSDPLSTALISKLV